MKLRTSPKRVGIKLNESGVLATILIVLYAFSMIGENVSDMLQPWLQLLARWEKQIYIVAISVIAGSAEGAIVALLISN